MPGGRPRGLPELPLAKRPRAPPARAAKRSGLTHSDTSIPCLENRKKQDGAAANSGTLVLQGQRQHIFVHDAFLSRGAQPNRPPVRSPTAQALAPPIQHVQDNTDLGLVSQKNRVARCPMTVMSRKRPFATVGAAGRIEVLGADDRIIHAAFRAEITALQYPVLMPIRIWKGCSKPLARHSCGNSIICGCMATAIRTQARAASSTPLVSGRLCRSPRSGARWAIRPFAGPSASTVVSA
jgi:hypothetical protein